MAGWLRYQYRLLREMFNRKDLSKHLRTEPDQQGIWSDEKRFEAVAAWIALGKMAKVRDITQIPLNTLWSWKRRSPWWEELEKQLRAEQNNETASKISSLVDQAIEGIRTRLSDGDWVYNPRSGELARVPVSAAALNKIATTLLDRRLVLEKETLPQEEEIGDTARLEKQLSRLADSFKAFVKAKEKEEKVIDHALHDERQEGLPEGA